MIDQQAASITAVGLRRDSRLQILLSNSSRSQPPSTTSRVLAKVLTFPDVRIQLAKLSEKVIEAMPVRLLILNPRGEEFYEISVAERCGGKCRRLQGPSALRHDGMEAAPPSWMPFTQKYLVRPQDEASEVPCGRSAF